MSFCLEVQNISQTSGGNPDASSLFENVSFRWESPGLHVIMGASGAGKSSLLKSIGGVWKPLKGKVLIDGQALWIGRHQNLEVLKRIGFAFQNNALFNSLRVIENVAFPHRQKFPDISEKDRMSLAYDWLAKVGLEASAPLYPHELSGGMQKRLSIARTLVLKPDFIFLDDPTAGLDPITSKNMADLVSSLLAGSNALVVIVTNDPDRARDWGPNIHYLIDRHLISRKEEKYSDIEASYL